MILSKKQQFVCIRLILLISGSILLASSLTAQQTIDVGVARVDITPQVPIRLAGYGARDKTESQTIIHRLWAKALAFGSDAQKPSVLITLDLIGITDRIASKLSKALEEKAGIGRDQLVLCSSHTHGGPEIGNTLNILQFRGNDSFSDSLLMREQAIHIAQYTEWLSRQLYELSLAALKDRKPALVSWGQGQASFANNRRTEGGPVDVALPFLQVKDPGGQIRAVLVNYACHGTTLEGINEIHGDWIGEAQLRIEERHPGTVALIAIGCGADANPKPRGKMEHMKAHGIEVADKVDKLLAAQLTPLTSPPAGKIKWIQLPLSKIPTIDDLVKGTGDKGLRGYFARIWLERVLRGDSIDRDVRYPVQVWNFGDRMAMVNLAGEVVVDYSLRLKNELGAERLWVNGYSNDVPSYIASRRVIREGGYEADYSQLCYDKPSPYVEEIEDMIVSAVHELMPPSFRTKRDTVNRQQLVERGEDGAFHLIAAHAESVGPNIRYMPEWKAFGWFNTDDRAEWQVKVDRSGRYDVFLDWSVSDEEAGKAFAFESGNKKLKGRVARTGSWYTYAKKKIGTLNLIAGTQKMVFKSNAPSEKGAMLDLAEVTLVPVE